MVVLLALQTRSKGLAGGGVYIYACSDILPHWYSEERNVGVFLVHCIIRLSARICGASSTLADQPGVELAW